MNSFVRRMIGQPSVSKWVKTFCAIFVVNVGRFAAIIVNLLDRIPCNPAFDVLIGSLFVLKSRSPSMINYLFIYLFTSRQSPLPDVVIPPLQSYTFTFDSITNKSEIGLR